MDRDSVYDLLVSRGLDDWLQPADFFDVARYTGPLSEDQYRSEAVALAQQLLLRGDGVAGDLVGGGHRPWSGSVEEQSSRIRALWSDTDIDPRFAFIWFDLTDTGRELALQALARIPELD